MDKKEPPISKAIGRGNGLENSSQKPEPKSFVVIVVILGFELSFCAC
jgi:hypothetical protein